MIDYVKLVYHHPNISQFIEDHKNDLKGVFSFDTGEITFPFTFEIKGYTIEIKESRKKDFHYINIGGSLHKNFYNGPNHEQFTHAQVVEEIYSLCEILQLEPEKLIIKNLEVGVNIMTTFPPFKYLDNNLLLYKTHPFKKYCKGKDGKELGFYHDGTPIVKIYDKGLQYNLPYNLMRFELRYKKSKLLSKMGIVTLCHLIELGNLIKLAKQLTLAWSNIILYECDLNTSLLTNSEVRLFKELEHPKNWLKLLNGSRSRTPFYRTKPKFNIIIERYGKNVHKSCGLLIDKEIEVCTKFPHTETVKVYEFTNTLKCNNVHIPETRYCKTCGKPLHPEQRKTSVYCSEKFVGKKEGKKCRNANSNNRNRVSKIMSKGVLFDANEIFDRTVMDLLRSNY